MKKILSIVSVLVIIICIGSLTANAAETEKKEYSTAMCSTACVNRNNAECAGRADCTRKADCRSYNEFTERTGVCHTSCRENCTAESKTACPNAENRQRRNNCSGINNSDRGHCAGRGGRAANCLNK